MGYPEFHEFLFVNVAAEATLPCDESCRRSSAHGRATECNKHLMATIAVACGGMEALPFLAESGCGTGLCVCPAPFVYQSERGSGPPALLMNTT